MTLWSGCGQPVEDAPCGCAQPVDISVDRSWTSAPSPRLTCENVAHGVWNQSFFASGRPQAATRPIHKRGHLASRRPLPAHSPDTGRSPRLLVALARPLLRLGRLDLTVLRGRARHELVQQPLGHRGHLLDGLVEGLLVGPARLGGPAHLAHVLQRGGTHLIARRGRLEVVQLTDVSAHAPSLHRRRGSAHPLRTGCRPPPSTNHLVAVGGVPEHGGMSSAAAPEHPTTPAETTLVLRVLTVATFVVILNETIMNN